MANFDLGSAPRRGVTRFATTAGVLALGALLAATPASSRNAAPAAAGVPCKVDPIGKINVDTGLEPLMHIDGTCVDPVYNEKTFVIDKTEQLTYQVPDGGPLIPYTQVTGHFPAIYTLQTLPLPIRQSPTAFQQNYVFRFPAKEFWKNRSFEQQHPTGGGVVDNRMAFTNGAFSVNWMSASVANAPASHRHEAAATKVATAYANKLYGNSAKIYHYFWGCSGGGIVAMGAAENTSGVWDGIGVHCMGPSGLASIESFYWQALYIMAIPKAKREAIAAAAAPGGTGDIYAGLNDEEKAVLTEFISAGYPLPIIGNSYNNLALSLVDPIYTRLADPTYDIDFWSKPGYAGTNPPNYLKAALVDGCATVTGVTRDASGAPVAVQFDPATIPPMGTIGDTYLEYWVYGPDGKTRLIDPNRAVGIPTDNKRRWSLQGKLDSNGLLALTGINKDNFGGTSPITNSPILLSGLQVGSKVRINNRFLLAIYFYPRYTNIPGMRSFDQYRNTNGSPKYPQRADLSVLKESNYGTMGGRIESGAITTKVMIIEGRGDNLSWPLFDASYAQSIQRTLGAAKANEMMRFYLHDNGRHAVGGGEPGVWQQALQDMMAWAEKGVAPPPSTVYTIHNGQVIPADNAADRHGLQPVMSLTANGVSRATVGVGQPVMLASKLEMPPKTGMIVQYGWTIGPAPASGATPPPAGPGAPPPPAVPMTVLDKPQTLANVSRTVSFDKPGTYVVRLTVNGQRDGLINPANQTLMQNYKEVRVIVQ